jgi:hypothetical protein
MYVLAGSSLAVCYGGRLEGISRRVTFKIRVPCLGKVPDMSDAAAHVVRKQVGGFYTAM